MVLNTLKNNPNANGKEIIMEMKYTYGIEVPYWKAHRAAEAARQQIFGSFDDSYNHLRRYCEAIKQTNLGGIITLESDPVTHEFIRVFITFKGCMNGFKSCRPMLFVDGTFMKGRASGTLLAATTKDGDNSLFPVAFAIVSAENMENWTWFLTMISDNIKHQKTVYYISDRNLSLMKAFDNVFDQSVHYYYLFHLLLNLKGRMSKGWTTTHREMLGVQFIECTYDPTVRAFEDKIAIFKETGGKIAEDFLKNLPEEQWALTYSPHISRYGEMTSNAAESFNAWILESRLLPITHMIDDIRTEIIHWYMERRQANGNWNEILVPSKNNLWHYLADANRTWYEAACPGGDYQVSTNPSVRVDLSTRTCSCHKWQLTGFSCAHVVAVICRRGVM